MKRCWLISCFLVYHVLNAQSWQTEVGDIWFNNRIRTGLNIGDTMPDIPLGIMMNNYTGKTRFSDFKGKLVILDMWNTSCSSCIAFFPKMEKLQKKFGNQIQIFIVNPYETQEQIEKGLKTRNDFYKRVGMIKRAELPNLPSIVGAEALRKLFPPRFVPHHVWIDQKGVIRVIGSEKNTYEEKIRDLLMGKEITCMKDDNITPLFNKDIAYSALMRKPIHPQQYNSYITTYNRDYAALSGGSVENLVDSVEQTIRNTWVNKTAWDIYLRSFPEFNQYLLNQMIYNSNPQNTLFLTKDTVRYTSGFLSAKADDYKIVDTNYIKSRICYEQITPLGYSKENRGELMLKDLNDFFGKLYGTEVKLEKRKTSCYVLVRIATGAKLITGNNTSTDNSFIENDKKTKKNKGISLLPAIQAAILNDQFLHNIEGKSFCFLDETGYGRKKIDINIVLPKAVNNLDELKNILQRYDLDIIQTEREVPFVVFRER